MQYWLKEKYYTGCSIVNNNVAIFSEPEHAEFSCCLPLLFLEYLVLFGCLANCSLMCSKDFWIRGYSTALLKDGGYETFSLFKMRYELFSNIAKLSFAQVPRTKKLPLPGWSHGCTLLFDPFWGASCSKAS